MSASFIVINVAYALTKWGVVYQKNTLFSPFSPFFNRNHHPHRLFATIALTLTAG